MGDGLSERFLAPPGWRTGFLTNSQTGHQIHYGFTMPARPRAVVVCVGGLSEFSEKYYELAHDMLDRGFAFWFMDWAYQGRSTRLEKYPHRRHTDGFEKDISDLAEFIENYIRPTHSGLPIILIGHSMGANIGLRYLSQHSGSVLSAAFTAPLLGIYNFKWPLKLLAFLLRPFMKAIGELYVFSGSDWRESMRPSNGTDRFSSDPVRDAIHNHWSRSFPDLQVGSPTFLWVMEALKSCAVLQKPDVLESIRIPVLTALAGDDKIVDNEAIRKNAGRIPAGRLIEIPNARHEILMECDEYRNTVLNAFDKMLEEHKIITF